MTLKEFAEKLNNAKLEYLQLPSEIIDEAKENGFVIVTGASDDLIEFDGAYTEEAGCFNGAKITFDSDGTDDDGYVHKNLINVYWCGMIDGEEVREYEATWEYETDIPHETFDMWDNGELYCKGIVFRVEDMK